MIYQEYESTFSNNHRTYDLNKIFKFVHNKKTRLLDISKLKWMFKHIDKLNKNRINKADINIPIIITKENDRYIVVDGMHRLQKSINNNKTVIPYKYLSKKELNQSLIKELI